MSKFTSEIFGRFNNALVDHNKEVEITRGYIFRYQNLIRKIELYRSSKFISGERDSEGYKKYFFNVCNPQAGNVTKFIDLDVKDVLFRSKAGQDRLKTTILTEAFRYYAKKEKFGLLLNEISEQLPIWGHVILRKYKDKIKRLHLRDVFWDQSVKDIHSSPYLIFRHYFQPADLDKMKAKGWNKASIDKINEEGRKAKVSDILVYEYMAEFPNAWVGKKGSGYTRGVVFLATNQNQINYNQDHRHGQRRISIKEVLFAQPIEEYPVKELKMFEVEGRAIGLGVFEMLFDVQERSNEITNQRASSMRMSTKSIFQTRDSLVQSNIMDDVLNGEIMKVQSEITPIQNQEKNLQAYQQEDESLLRFTRNIANAQEVLTGESLPSGTPFRLGALLQQNASALFGYIREKYGLFVKEIVEDWILPDFTPEALKKQILEVQNQDLIEQINERDINRRVNDSIKGFVLKNGYYPRQSEVETLKNFMRTQQEPVKFMDIAKDYLKVEYDVDVVVTDEQENTAQKVESLTNTIQLLAQNPNAMVDPGLKKVLNELLELTGVSSRVVPGATPVQGSEPQLSPAQAAQGSGTGGPVSGTGGQPPPR